MSGHPTQNVVNGQTNAGMNVSQQPQGATSAGGQNQSAQNLNHIVLEYLVKKGYTRTEQTLRAESANTHADGRPVMDRVEDEGTGLFRVAFDLLSGWIDTNLDIYKFELSRLLWPIFMYSYLELVMSSAAEEAQNFLRKFRWHFDRIHADELRTLETISAPQHVLENPITKLYQQNKYRLPLNTHVYFNLITFLEQNGKTGGTVILKLLQTHCEVKETERGPIDQYSFEAIANRAHDTTPAELGDVQEGIPGGFTGVSNQDIQDNNTHVNLGPARMEPELIQDVRGELQDEDIKFPVDTNQMSLIEAFDRKIKREESADAITRADIPYPPSRARDVIMEVQKIKEYRDRFKIAGRTGGIGPAVSVCMFTFHNTLDTLTSIEFSDDYNLVAVGTEESYIRVWQLHGEPLSSNLGGLDSETALSGSRRLIGHSGPVYSLSFSPSTSRPDDADDSTPSTTPRLLLSSSADKTIRLWSLEAWACLVVFKGHEGPVWNVRWGPFGHYFATCGWDKTARLWSQDQISYLRLLVGHDSNVSQIAWHPNGAYVFSASDQVDKTVRMWSFVTGNCVRVFTGHTEFISALECSPDGKMLASADGGGSIILWDLAKGTQIKRCRGHGRGGIWSLAFSVESTVLTSGGADGTVRIWDINVPSDPYRGGDGDASVAGAPADGIRVGNTGIANGQAGVGVVGSATTGPPGIGGVGGGGKKKGKEMVITPDQISAFLTKKTPVYKVKFTRMNLVMAGGCYLP